jgi:DNA-binding response OmpR family regulator
MAGQATIKMLSIDDKTVTTDLDRAGYRKMGVLVKPAASFDEANKLLKAEKIDLIVINMDYRGVDAVNVTKHLKAQGEYAATPIVLTSVQTAAKVRNSALDAGADLFVEQPLPRQYFIEKLKQLLEQQTRTTERVQGHGGVSFTYGDHRETCPIGDLSVSGILLSTNVEMEDGTVITLEFDLPGNKKPIKVQGEVVRTIKFSNKFPDRQTGVGIRFVDFGGDSQKRLEKYIEKTAHGDSRMQYYL